MKKTVPTLALLLLMLCPPPVVAQSAGTGIIRISPLIIPVSLSPGTAVTQEVTIENLTDTPLPAQLSVENFSEDESSGRPVQQAQDMPGGMAGWITFPSPDLLLPPRGSTTVTATITVPAQIPLGGYYAMMYVTPSLPVATGAAPRIIPKLGILILGSIGVPPQDLRSPRATVSRFEIVPRLNQTNPVRTVIRATNTSLSHITAKPILTLTPLWGSVQRIMLPEKVVFPGKSRSWEESISVATPNRILYRAELQLSTGGGQTVTERTVFFFFPWQTPAALLSLILTVGILFRARRRIGNAMRELTSRET